MEEEEEEEEEDFKLGVINLPHNLYSLFFCKIFGFNKNKCAKNK